MLSYNLRKESECISKVVRGIKGYICAYYIGSITCKKAESMSPYSDVDLFVIIKNSISSHAVKSINKKISLFANKLDYFSHFSKVSARIVCQEKIHLFERHLYKWNYDLTHSINIESLVKDYPHKSREYYFSYSEQLNSLIECIWYVFVRVYYEQTHEGFMHYITRKWQDQLVWFYRLYGIEGQVVRENEKFEFLLNYFLEAWNHILGKCSGSEFVITYFNLEFKTKYESLLFVCELVELIQCYFTSKNAKLSHSLNRVSQMLEKEYSSLEVLIEELEINYQNNVRSNFHLCK